MSRAAEIATALGGAIERSGGWWDCRCPCHEDRSASLGLKDGDRVPLVVKCQAGCDGAAVLAEIESRGLLNGGKHREHGRPEDTTRKAAVDGTMLVPVPSNAPEPPTRGAAGWWTYRDGEGRSLAVVIRREGANGKEIRQWTCWRNADGRPEWRPKALPAPRPLYGQEHLAQHADRVVVVTEGEKAADAVWKLTAGKRVVPVTSSHGARAAEKADWSPLRGRNVVVWPDADEQGQHYARSVARLAHAAGADSVWSVTPPESVPAGWDAADALADGWTAERASKLIRTARKVELDEVPDTVPEPAPEAGEIRAEYDDPAKAVADLNARHAQVVLGGRLTIMRETGDGEPAWWDKGAFLAHYEGRMVKVPKDKGTTLVPLARFWLGSLERRQYDRVVFSPDGNAPAGALNLWRGFAVEPTPGDWGLMQAHVREIVARGDEVISAYLLDWMAHAVQCPCELPEVAIALRGGQGTGKGILWRTFGSLFGPHYLHAKSPETLSGRFDLHLAHKIVLFADEAFFSGDARAASVLKARITEPELTFEGKGRDPIQLPNYARVVAASNERWAVPAGLDDRRWCVLDVARDYKEDAAYFGAISRQMREGGRGAMLYDLLHRNLDDFDPRAFPRTAARAENIVQGMEPITAAWYERLQAGGIPRQEAGERRNDWPEYIEIDTLRDQIRDFAKHQPRQAAVNDVVIGLTLRDLCPAIERKRKRVGIGLAYVYVLPPLEECRAAFEQATGFVPEWTPADVPELS